MVYHSIAINGGVILQVKGVGSLSTDSVKLLSDLPADTREHRGRQWVPANDTLEIKLGVFGRALTLLNTSDFRPNLNSCRAICA